MDSKPWLRSPALLVLVLAALLPLSLPLLFLALPIAGLYWLYSYNNSNLPPEPAGEPVELQANPLPPHVQREQPASIAAKSSTRDQPIGVLLHDNNATSNSTSTSRHDTQAPKAAAAKPAVGGAAILAKLRAQKAAAEKTKAAAAPTEVTVLYASQLGTAAEIAKNVAAEAESRGYKSTVASMNELGFDKLTADATPVIILVASSTGDGDAPDNAAKFYAAVRRRNQPEGRLAGVSFTCLGLGDSNYTRFMQVPRSLRNRFLELGAVSFYDFCEADEVDGLEVIVDAWTTGLWPALATLARADSESPDKENMTAAAAGKGASTEGQLTGIPLLPTSQVRFVWDSEKKISSTPTNDADVSYSADHPFLATISSARLLTTTTAGDRKVIHMELDLTGSGINYSPGDSIGVLPENADDLVDGILGRLSVDGNVVFSVLGCSEGEDGKDADLRPLAHLGWPCSVRTALQRGCDLTTPPRKSLLRLLAEHCNDPQERLGLLMLCSKEGRDGYAERILRDRPTFLDLLTQYPSCQPPISAILEALPPLPPRMYSIACAPAVNPNRVEVAFTVVRCPAPSSSLGYRLGVATGWLEKLLTKNSEVCLVRDLKIPIFLRSGGDFHPPLDLSVPWVFIGPGTGVAPFRGFLQDRRWRISQYVGEGGDATSIGECWMYFGCRRDDQDYLYEEDLKGFAADGTLSRLEVAFSRASQEKVYVQHLMAQHARELHDMLVTKKGYVFVCGDGASMAKDVYEVLVKIVGTSELEGKGALAAMAKEGRFVRDIWS